MNNLLVNVNIEKEKKYYKKKFEIKLRKTKKELIHDKDGRYQVYYKVSIKQHM